MAFGVSTSVAVPLVPTQATRALGRLTVRNGRRARLKRYARAMDWEFSPEGHLVGEVDGIALRVTEGPGPRRGHRHARSGDAAAHGAAVAA